MGLAFETYFEQYEEMYAYQEQERQERQKTHDAYLAQAAAEEAAAAKEKVSATDGSAPNGNKTN